MPAQRAAAVVLAAGASSRLGQPKQLVRLAGEALLERAVRLAQEAGCAPVIVVLGAAADVIESSCNLSDAQIIHNPQWTEGMASSIRSAVSQLPGEVEALLVLACDQPAVTASHLRALCAAAAGGGVAASAYGTRRGVPACFPASAFTGLMHLQGDTGARDLLQSARAIDLPGGELDVDTPESLAEMMRRYS